MGRQSMIAVPASILGRAFSEIEVQKSAFESLPHDLLLQISRYTDLFTIVNIARCSARLAMLVYEGNLLDFDPDDLTVAEQAFLLGSIPLYMGSAERRQHFWDLRKYAWDSDESESSYSWVEVRPGGICCKLCSFNKLRKSSSGRSYHKAWFRHMRIEVERHGGRVPRRMVLLLYRALTLLEEGYQRKLGRAAFLTLKVPGLPTH